MSILLVAATYLRIRTLTWQRLARSHLDRSTKIPNKEIPGVGDTRDF